MIKEPPLSRVITIQPPRRLTHRRCKVRRRSNDADHQIEIRDQTGRGRKISQLPRIKQIDCYASIPPPDRGFQTLPDYFSADRSNRSLQNQDAAKKYPAGYCAGR